MLVSEELVARLPAPVQRSLRWSGVVGSRVPAGVVVDQEGRIRTSQTSRWLRFKARETYELAQPGFEWRASLRIGPFAAGRVTDSIRDGVGRMNVKLLGLVDVVDAAGPEIDQGSLLRWLNETMWFPAVWVTDLIQWESVDEYTAVGSVTTGDLTVRAKFCFDAEGRLIDFHADRYRDIGEGRFALTRWSTPIREYARLGGLRLPAGGAGVWHLPQSDFEYIEIRALRVEYSTKV